MRVLYLGATHPSSTARHRAEALRRLGCEVDLHDPYEAVQGHTRGLLGALHYRTGYLLLRRVVTRWLLNALAPELRYDICWVDNGELLSRDALAHLQRQCQHLVLFNHDDPTGTRDGARFMTLKDALPGYDLCVVVRHINLAVLRVWMSYDEVAHRPIKPERPIDPAHLSDIAFIGRRINGEDRDLFLRDLIVQGLKPAIWGDNWQSSPVWSILQPYWRGASLSGQDYVDAIRGAKICIGMLSKGNRDQHTTRTMEIPAAGGLLCAERTDEHQQLYIEGKEAALWSSAQECATLCKALLSNPAKREEIRLAGQRRVLSNQVGNQDLCKAVFKRLAIG
ncbi:MAG: glycosyltransferase [Pseudomonadota bacterium]